MASEDLDDHAWRGRLWFTVINVALGPLVPLSYVWSAKRWPNEVGGLWGDIPSAWQIPYAANMLFAAAGYLVFSWYVFRHGQQHPTSLGRLGIRAMCGAYLAILLPSMLWMPLTLYSLSAGRDMAWIIQVVLALVALGSLTVSWALFSATSEQRVLPWARAGTVFFCVQTVLLDAIVWPRFFTVSL